MDDVCIVCNRAIETHLDPEDANAAGNSDGESVHTTAHRKKSSTGPGAGAGGAAAHHKPRVQHHHHHGPVTRIRRNHSSGKLVGRGKNGTIKALSTHHHHKDQVSTAASTSENGHASEGESNDDATSGKTSPAPAWTSLYCSEECRKEDELSSRLSYANLSDQKEKTLARSYQQQQQQQQQIHQNASLNSQRRSSSHVSLQQIRSTSPSSPPVSSLSRSAAWPTSYIPSSPLANDSEGSEYDWSASSRVRSSERSRRDSSDYAHEASGSRRYSDGSDSSRGGMSVHFPRARRSSSRTRMSSDSLASYDEEYASRPELPHRSTSALSNGLRAMTPIHYSGSGSPRSGTAPLHATRSNTSPEAAQARATLSPSASMAMTRSNSDFAGSVSNFSSSLVSTSQHSAKTFRPASYSAKSHLKPSKSSATLALTSSGSDIKGTISSDPEYFGENHHGYGRDSAPHSSSFKVPNPPKYHAPMPAKHTHRPHASSSSIPYLSCSPSSPGSGSIVSARSTASTAPSSSGVRGEMDGIEGGRKARYVDERERHGSLNTYGLFHQRTPSTPSLTNLVNGYSSSYGRSPPSRATRLSSSFDQMANTSGTISEVIRNQRIASRRSSSNLLMTSTDTSPRRPSYERSHITSYPVTTDNTPTQSVAATRKSSFADSKLQAHEIIHTSHDENGRQRAPSITCTDLERIPSDHSFSSSSAMGVPKRYPPHLRPLQVNASDGSDASGSSPPSPGLPTPGPNERGYSYQHRQRSHPAIDQLHAEEYANKPLSPSSRSKSRSSFNWGHLPQYIPQYTAMNMDKIQRSKSGTSLHYLPEDEDPAHSADSQMTLRRPSVQTHKKRLFYFPDDV